MRIWIETWRCRMAHAAWRESLRRKAGGSGTKAAGYIAMLCLFALSAMAAPGFLDMGMSFVAMGALGLAGWLSHSRDGREWADKEAAERRERRAWMDARKAESSREARHLGASVSKPSIKGRGPSRL